MQPLTSHKRTSFILRCPQGGSDDADISTISYISSSRVKDPAPKRTLSHLLNTSTSIGTKRNGKGSGKKLSVHLDRSLHYLNSIDAFSSAMCLLFVLYIYMW